MPIRRIEYRPSDRPFNCSATIVGNLNCNMRKIMMVDAFLRALPPVHCEARRFRADAGRIPTRWGRPETGLNKAAGASPHGTPAAGAGNQAVASAYYDHGRPSRISARLSRQGTTLHNPCWSISLGHPRKRQACGVVSGFLLFPAGSKSRWARQAARARDFAWSQEPYEAGAGSFRLVTRCDFRFSRLSYGWGKIARLIREISPSDPEMPPARRAHVPMRSHLRATGCPSEIRAPRRDHAYPCG
jgi:hypothetical protein